MFKAEALREAKQWLQTLSDADAESEITALERGTVRPLVTASGPKPATAASEPARAGAPGRFAHPYYWAAFILVGDPW